MTPSVNQNPLATPRDVLRWLQETYPLPVILPETTMEEIQHKSGQASVAAALENVLDRVDRGLTRKRDKKHVLPSETQGAPSRTTSSGST